MVRNDVGIGPTIEKAVQQQIQNGFRLDPQTGDKKLDLKFRPLAALERLGDPEQCDLASEMKLADIESATFEAMLVDGDLCLNPQTDASGNRKPVIDRNDFPMFLLKALRFSLIEMHLRRPLRQSRMSNYLGLSQPCGKCKLASGSW